MHYTELGEQLAKSNSLSEIERILNIKRRGLEPSNAV
jgi:hypothetical protein